MDINKLKLPMSKHLKFASPTKMKYKLPVDTGTGEGRKTHLHSLETDKHITWVLENAQKMLAQYIDNPEALRGFFACYFDTKGFKTIDADRSFKRYLLTTQSVNIIEKIKKAFSVVNDTQVILIVQQGDDHSGTFKSITDKYKAMIQGLEKKVADLKSQYQKEKERVVKTVGGLEAQLIHKNMKLKEMEKKPGMKAIPEMNIYSKYPVTEERETGVDLSKKKYEKKRLKYKAQLLKKNCQIEILLKMLEEAQRNARSTHHDSNYVSDNSVKKTYMNLMSDYVQANPKLTRIKSLCVQARAQYFTEEAKMNNSNSPNVKKPFQIVPLEVSEMLEVSNIMEQAKEKSKPKIPMESHIEFENSRIVDDNKSLSDALLTSTVRPRLKVGVNPESKTFKLNTYNFFSNVSGYDMSFRDKLHSMMNTGEAGLTSQKLAKSNISQVKDEFYQHIKNYEMQLSIAYQISKAKSLASESVIQQLVLGCGEHMSIEELGIAKGFEEYKQNMGLVSTIINYERLSCKSTFNKSFTDMGQDDNLMDTRRMLAMDGDTDNMKYKIQEKKQVNKILIAKIIELEKRISSMEMNSKSQVMEQMGFEESQDALLREIQRLKHVCGELRRELEQKREEVRQFKDCDRASLCKYSDSNQSHITLRHKYPSTSVLSKSMRPQISTEVIVDSADAHYKDLLIESMSYLLDHSAKSLAEKAACSDLKDTLKRFVTDIGEKMLTSQSPSHNTALKDRLNNGFNYILAALSKVCDKMNVLVSKNASKSQKLNVKNLIEECLKADDWSTDIASIPAGACLANVVLKEVGKDRSSSGRSSVVVSERPSIQRSNQLNPSHSKFKHVIESLLRKIADLDYNHQITVADLSRKLNLAESKLVKAMSFQKKSSARLKKNCKKVEVLFDNLRKLSLIIQSRFGKVFTQLDALKSQTKNKMASVKAGFVEYRSKLLEYHEILQTIGNVLELNFYDIEVPALMTQLEKIKTSAASYTELLALYSQHPAKTPSLAEIKTRLDFLKKLAAEYKGYFSEELTLAHNTEKQLMSNCMAGLIMSFTGELHRDKLSVKSRPEYHKYEKINTLVNNIEEASNVRIVNFTEQMLESPINQLWSHENFVGFCNLAAPNQASKDRITYVIDNIEQYYKSKYHQLIEETKSENSTTLVEYNKLITKYINLQQENIAFKKQNSGNIEPPIDIKKYNKLKIHLKNLEQKMAFVNKILKSLDLDINDKDLKSKFLDKISSLMYDSKKINLSILKEPSRNYKNLGQITEEDSVNYSEHYDLSLDKYMNYSVKEPIDTKTSAFGDSKKSKTKAYSEHNKPQIKGLSLINTFNDDNMLSKSAGKGSVNHEALFESMFKK